MLELDEESMVVRSVTPTTAALYGTATTSLPSVGAAPQAAHTPNGPQSRRRCSSTSSRIRKKFTWLRSPSPSLRRPPPPPEAVAAAASSDQQVVREAALAGRERRRVQARLLNWSRSEARRALKGLRFISRTTTDADGGVALWRPVEVMLELDKESMVVHSVTPTTAALYGAPTASLFGAGAAHTSDGPRSLSRCLSTSSRIRRKFAWLR